MVQFIKHRMDRINKILSYAFVLICFVLPIIFSFIYIIALIPSFLADKSVFTDKWIFWVLAGALIPLLTLFLHFGLSKKREETIIPISKMLSPITKNSYLKWIILISLWALAWVSLVMGFGQKRGGILQALIIIGIAYFILVSKPSKDKQ